MRRNFWTLTSHILSILHVIGTFGIFFLKELLKFKIKLILIG